jgi:hypothetical protein
VPQNIFIIIIIIIIIIIVIGKTALLEPSLENSARFVTRLLFLWISHQ